ncbi:ribonuclease domain-containing protein [Brasilonema sp. UFV-L1]|uniref:ribonuclease domain-containing protein n=1 Tax=Brasilonema sp. UFV-L1 TaxID=2234130 RepID=UPI00145D3762|nr:ribonuclease domain-containing protein [Brasilonema sp. UFV-L1]NMG08386.1 hypothetical protein [Brasilonema sp. UFV-L1]
MKAQIVEQVELFSEAELQSLEFVPEELEAIEAERVPDLESISFEDIAEDLEAYFKGGVEEAALESRGGRRGGKGKPSPAERNQIRDIKDNITNGRLGGRVYNNAGGHGGTRLTPARKGQEYREYDLGQANDGSRGKHRLVVLIGSDRRSVEKMYYTNNHYTSFTPIR